MAKIKIDVNSKNLLIFKLNFPNFVLLLCSEESCAIIRRKWRVNLDQSCFEISISKVIEIHFMEYH